MRKLSLLWALLVSVLFVVGCNPDTPEGGNDGVKPEITIEQNAVDFNSFTFDVTTTVAGELGYVVVSEGYNAPNINEWFNSNSAEVKDTATITVDGLNDNTNYTLYAVLRAADGGVLSAPKNIKFTTPDDGENSPISIDYVGYDTIKFTINIEGSYVFQCIDKAYLEYMNVTPEEYIATPGIGIASKGIQEVEWYNGGKYGNYDMNVREDSEYYVLAAVTDGQNITNQIYVVQIRTLRRPQSDAGITTELKNITSTSVTIATTPDDTVIEYYVLVRDKIWVDGIISGYGESMLATLVKRPSAGSWHLTDANEQEWGGLLTSTDYCCLIVVVDKAGAEALSKYEFKTSEASLAAPEVEVSLTKPEEDGHKTLSINLYSADAASVKVAFNTKADIAGLRNQDLDDEYIVNNYGMDLSAEQVEAVRTTGLSLKMEDLYPEVEYIAIVSVKNIEQTATIKAAQCATAAKPIPQRVESDLFTSLLGEWEVSYDLVQFNMEEVSIYNAKVTIAQGVDATTEKSYREQNRLVILGWPFNVMPDGTHEPMPLYTPADLADADAAYWGAYPQIAYRDYGPKIFLQIGEGDKVVVPSERGEYFYNWSSDGTFYFYGADIANEFTAPATFPVTVSDGGDTLIIGASEPVEEFGFGVYRPAVFRDYSPWALATSDIVLKRVK
ncbi:MAG: hypothetical protein J6R90_07035 [Alistipes sp.]|nr:hypothetical protein [Alistipes sp.]